MDEQKRNFYKQVLKSLADLKIGIDDFKKSIEYLEMKIAGLEKKINTLYSYVQR